MVAASWQNRVSLLGTEVGHVYCERSPLLLEIGAVLRNGSPSREGRVVIGQTTGGKQQLNLATLRPPCLSRLALVLLGEGVGALADVQDVCDMAKQCVGGIVPPPR